MESITIELIAIGLLIIFSGFLAALEISIASYGEGKIEELKEKNEKSAEFFEKIHSQPENFFASITIGATLCQVSAAAIGIYAADKLFGKPLLSIFNEMSEFYVGIVSAVITIIFISFLIWVFGTLVPKAIAFKFTDKIAIGTVKFFYYYSQLFKYPAKVITSVSNFLLLPIRERINFAQTKLSEDEIRIIISEGVKSGAIDKTEHEIIENVLEFNDLRAKEVMIPRTEMQAIEYTDNDDDMIKQALTTGHSLIPIYKESLDNIIGILHSKDLMKALVNKERIAVNDLIRPSYFVPETKLISEILKEMQKRGERIAIVMDEYGGTEGVIALEDILEEIVGNIGDITQDEIKDYSLLPDGKYYVLGSMGIDDFNEIFSHDLPKSEEYNTIAGFVAEKTGKILDINEIFEYEKLRFELIKKLKQKMVQFKLYSIDGSLKESLKK